MGLFSLIQANIKMIDKFVWIAFFFWGTMDEWTPDNAERKIE